MCAGCIMYRDYPTLEQKLWIRQPVNIPSSPFFYNSMKDEYANACILQMG